MQKSTAPSIGFMSSPLPKVLIEPLWGPVGKLQPSALAHRAGAYPHKHRGPYAKTDRLRPAKSRTALRNPSTTCWYTALRLPFTVDKYRIYNALGSEFIFKGLSKQDAAAIKSLGGADIVWVEEAQNVSNASWQNLIPTIRKEGSEIWVSFNPTVEEAPTYHRLVLNPPPGALVVKVGWRDHPWRSKVLDDDREHMRTNDPAGYDNVYEGNCRTFSEGAYFRDEIEALRRDGRIGDVPYNPNKTVWTFWDLSHAASGKGDPHSIRLSRKAMAPVSTCSTIGRVTTSGWVKWRRKSFSVVDTPMPARSSA